MTAVKIEVTIVERDLVEHLQPPALYNVVCIDTCVILVFNSVREEHNPHL